MDYCCPVPSTWHVMYHTSQVFSSTRENNNGLVPLDFVMLLVLGIVWCTFLFVVFMVVIVLVDVLFVAISVIVIVTILGTIVIVVSINRVTWTVSTHFT